MDADRRVHPQRGRPSRRHRRGQRRGRACAGSAQPARADRPARARHAPTPRAPGLGRPARGCGVPRELGRTVGLAPLVRRRARVHRALAPPGPDQAGGRRPARAHHPAALRAGPRDLHAGRTLRVSGAADRGRHVRGDCRGGGSAADGGPSSARPGAGASGARARGSPSRRAPGRPPCGYRQTWRGACSRRGWRPSTPPRPAPWRATPPWAWPSWRHVRSSVDAPGARYSWTT